MGTGNFAIAVARFNGFIVESLQAGAIDMLERALPDEELKARMDKWQPKPPPYDRGTLSKYIKLVQPAAKGAVTG